MFSTKGRRQLLRAEERGQLNAYFTGILKNHDSPLIEINSARDHIHIRFAQSKKPRTRENCRAGQNVVIGLAQGATRGVCRFRVANRLRRVQRQPDAGFETRRSRSGGPYQGTAGQ